MNILERMMGSRVAPARTLQTWYRDQSFILLLLLAIVIVYGQTLGFSFILWDDPEYVRPAGVPPGLTLVGLNHAFTSLQMTHWQPLTMMSHMLDVELFGASAGAHHGVNLLIHAINSLLVFALLRSTTKAFWPSAFVAAVFALHPLHVENVAWIADRKDLLSAFFGLLALHAYVRFVARRRWVWYCAVLILFCLGFMCKSMIVTLPIMCLLLDYWPLGRGEPSLSEGDARAAIEPERTSEPRRMRRAMHWSLLREKIPLCVLAIGFGIMTYIATQYGGWVEYYGRVSLKGRVVNSVCSHAWYIAKTLWPSKLAALYVHPDLPGGVPWQSWEVVGAILLLGFISWLVWWLRRPYLVMGWLWFVGTLLPVNGLVQIGNPGRADHYMYMPLIGLLIMLGWGIAELPGHFKAHRRVSTGVAAGGAVSILLIHATMCWVQTGYWRNSVIFYERQMQLVPNNPYFNSNMALAYVRSGKPEQAIIYANRALAIWPRLYEAHFVLDEVYLNQDAPELAKYHRDKAEDMLSLATQEHERTTVVRYFLGKTVTANNETAPVE